ATIADDNGGSAGNMSLSAGSATLTSFTFNTAGTQTLTAADATATLAPNTSANVTVNKIGSTTTVASSLNPSAVGQSVTFTATVSGGAGTPTGTVTFKDGATSLATNALTSVQATFTTSALSSGARSITAVYNGDGNYNSSTSSTLTQTVSKASSTA